MVSNVACQKNPYCLFRQEGLIIDHVHSTMEGNVFMGAGQDQNRTYSTVFFSLPPVGLGQYVPYPSPTPARSDPGRGEVRVGTGDPALPTHPPLHPQLGLVWGEGRSQSVLPRNVNRRLSCSLILLAR